MFLKRFQLGLVHLAVAMTLVPINSTLNRVMIKELAISATLVAVLASLPYFFAPIQVLIGSYSDRHPLWGYRRTPYIVMGLLLCVLGLVVSPQAAFLMSTDLLAGVLVGVVAFGAWGMGFNLATVSYLSLASEISGENGRGRTVAVMWFMMIVSIIFTAIGLGQMVDPYTPQALQRAFWVVGLAALALGLLGLIRLEKRTEGGYGMASDSYSWSVLVRTVLSNRQATFFFIYLTILLAAILGQDILLEPFGGQAFDLSVRQTTRITAIWGSCFLVTLLIAGALERRLAKKSMARFGGWGALVGFVLIAASGVVLNSSLYYLGIVVLGLGTGLATVANLALMLDMTVPEKVGLFIGAWGMSNAISRLIGSIMAGVVRDVVTQATGSLVGGYVTVFGLMAGMMLISLFMLNRIDVQAFRRQAEDGPSLVERAAMASEA
jgi:BCD family chlorophyll transporter-like MFS transporter